MEKINRYSTLNWGISTLGCPELNLPQAVELADRYGIKYFEIRTLNNTVNCQETLYYPENEPVMRKLAAECRCQVLDSSFGFTADKPGQREALAEIARTADDFNIPYIRIFGGGNYGEALTSERIKNAVENMKWFNSQKFNARLALETHDICSGSDFCLALQENIGEKLPIIWDAHHTRQIALEDFQTSFSKLSDNIVSVHFKDSHYATKDGVEYCEFDLIGKGLVPMDELFTLLSKNNVKVPVTLEHEKFWRKNLPELAVMLDSWVEFCCK
ncbi:MAG: sugar phosphate isomerase/epimerase [Lentisphaeria bacterium]|nr:sugar phosphate isomerase/epimerase [Lentisphaeria bacterium]